MKYLTILILFFICSACPNEPDCIRNYTFEIPINVIPNQETLKIGDTLLVSMNTDNTQLYDNHGERIVYFPNFDPNAWFLMPILDTFPVKDGFLYNELIIDKKFKVHQTIVANQVSGIFFLGIDTTEFNSQLDFKLVLNSPGTYALYSISEMWINSDEICFPSKCDGCGYGKGNIEGEFKYNSDINKNILNTIEIDNENKYWKDRHGQRSESSPYYFRVVE